LMCLLPEERRASESPSFRDDSVNRREALRAVTLVLIIMGHLHLSFFKRPYMENLFHRRLPLSKVAVGTATLT